MSRPPLISSTAFALAASIAGLWKLVDATSGPSSTRVVIAASAASWLHASHGPTGSRPSVAVEEVVADPDRVEADPLGGPRHLRQLRPAHDALDLGELDSNLQWPRHRRGDCRRAYRVGVEAPDPLGSMPFSYATRSDGSIVISYHTAPVTILRGRSAERFATRIADADAAASQQLMARATGSVQARQRAGRQALAG